MSLVRLDPSASMTYISLFPSRLDRKTILLLSGAGVGVGVCVGTGVGYVRMYVSAFPLCVEYLKA